MLGRNLKALTALLGAVAMLLSAGGAEAQHPKRRGGFGPGWLLMFPEVQRELRLDQEQVERVQQLAGQMRTRSQEMFRSIQNLPPEERGRRFMAFDKEYRQRIGDILDRKQTERLDQIGLQREGIRALGRPDVAGELRLSSEQRQRVQTILEQERASVKELFGPVAGTMSPKDRETIRLRMGEIHRGTDSRLNAVLSEGQKRDWQGMLGAPFKLPDFRPRRGGED